MSSAETSSAETSTPQIKLDEKQMDLVRWEEFALAMEEHYHAIELWLRRPEGLPMGHR